MEIKLGLTLLLLAAVRGEDLLERMCPCRKVRDCRQVGRPAHQVVLARFQLSPCPDPQEVHCCQYSNHSVQSPESSPARPSMVRLVSHLTGLQVDGTRRLNIVLRGFRRNISSSDPPDSDTSDTSHTPVKKFSTRSSKNRTTLFIRPRPQKATGNIYEEGLLKYKKNTINQSRLKNDLIDTLKLKSFENDSTTPISEETGGLKMEISESNQTAVGNQTDKILLNTTSSSLSNRNDSFTNKALGSDSTEANHTTTGLETLSYGQAKNFSGKSVLPSGIKFVDQSEKKNLGYRARGNFASVPQRRGSTDDRYRLIIKPEPGQQTPFSVLIAPVARHKPIKRELPVIGPIPKGSRPRPGMTFDGIELGQLEPPSETSGVVPDRLAASYQLALRRYEEALQLYRALIDASRAPAPS